MVYRDPQTDFDAIVAIDTTRATAADIEGAMHTIGHVADHVPTSAKHKDILGSLVPPPNATARNNSGPGSRSDGFLRLLGHSAEAAMNAFGHGRVFDVVLDRRSLSR